MATLYSLGEIVADQYKRSINLIIKLGEILDSVDDDLVEEFGSTLVEALFHIKSSPRTFPKPEDEEKKKKKDLRTWQPQPRYCPQYDQLRTKNAPVPVAPRPEQAPSQSPTPIPTTPRCTFGNS